MKKIIFILFVSIFVIASANAANLSDISYYYTKGVAFESVANFAEAADNYKKCLEIAKDDENAWYDLCSSSYERITKITKKKTRDLLADVPWEFKGEFINKDLGITSHYYLTKENELIIIDAFKPKGNLTDEDLLAIVEDQKGFFNESYGLSTGEIEIEGKKVYFMLASDNEEQVTIFNGLSYNDKTQEVYNIRAILKNVNIENFKSELQDSKFGVIGLMQIRNIIIIIIIVSILIIALIFLFLYKYRKSILKKFKKKWGSDAWKNELEYYFKVYTASIFQILKVLLN